MPEDPYAEFRKPISTDPYAEFGGKTIAEAIDAQPHGEVPAPPLPAPGFPLFGAPGLQPEPKRGLARSIWELPNIGARQVSEAVPEMATAIHGINPAKDITQQPLDPLAGATSHLIRGVGTMFSPLAAPAAVLNPISALGAVAGGAAGGMAGGAGARLIGAGPGVTSLAEDTGALIGGGAGGRFAEPVTRLNLPRASNRVFRPLPADTDFPAIAPEAFSDVRRFGGGVPGRSLMPRPSLGFRRAPEAGVTDLQAGPGTATTTAIAHLQEHGLEPWLANARAMGVQIPGDEIVAATRSAIPSLMRTRDPAGAAALEQQAQDAFGGRTFTPDQFRDFLRTENATLAPFYAKGAGAQQGAVSAGTPPAIEKAQAETMRELLYRYLDPENAGAGPREIQARTGNVINLRNAAERKANTILGEKPLTPIGGLANLAKAPLDLFRRGPLFAGGEVAHPWRGPSDALISRLYRGAPEAAELPTPPQFAPTALLGRPSAITPPPAESASPFTRTTPWAATPTYTAGQRPALPSPIRGLLEGPTRITPPPADTSGPINTGPLSGREPYMKPIPRLGPPMQTPQTGFAAAGQGAGIRPLVAHTNPTTGQIEYVEPWMLQKRLIGQ
jgi:hypothetical protein